MSLSTVIQVQKWVRKTDSPKWMIPVVYTLLNTDENKTVQFSTRTQYTYEYQSTISRDSLCANYNKVELVNGTI